MDGYEWQVERGTRAIQKAEQVASEIVALKGVRFSSEAREIMASKLALLWLDGAVHGEVTAYTIAEKLISQKLPAPPA